MPSLLFFSAARELQQDQGPQHCPQRCPQDCPDLRPPPPPPLLPETQHAPLTQCTLTLWQKALHANATLTKLHAAASALCRH